MKVVPFPQPSLNDIPAMLHQLADDIEAGEYGDVKASVTVLETGDHIRCLYYGEADMLRSIGILSAGTAMLNNIMWEVD